MLDGIIAQGAVLGRGLIEWPCRDSRDRLFEALLDLSRREGDTVTQTEVARRISEIAGREVTQSMVSRWLSGEATPTIENVQHAAKALGVAEEWLAFGKGLPRPDEVKIQKGRRGRPL